jgi:hypothetical protein
LYAFEAIPKIGQHWKYKTKEVARRRGGESIYVKTISLGTNLVT